MKRFFLPAMFLAASIAHAQDFLIGKVHYLPVKNAYPNETDVLLAEAERMAKITEMDTKQRTITRNPRISPSGPPGISI